MEEEEEGRPLALTPTWAVATVMGVIVGAGSLFHVSLNVFGKWLYRTKRKSLFAVLDKIKDELMLFGLLSLLMSHWAIYVAKICVRSSNSPRFHPCTLETGVRTAMKTQEVMVSTYYNESQSWKVPRVVEWRNYCPEGYESFASYESLEQLHRLLFTLGVTHIFYSLSAVAFAIVKIYSWRKWEIEAISLATDADQENPEASPTKPRMRRLATFVSQRTSHPWSQHEVLVWMHCFIRQFWSSINKSDYNALRYGFIIRHELPLSYDFHNYMLRSMDEEFCDIVGVSIPLWIYAILCIFLDFHGSDAYFWFSFLPAILILALGTKLHHIVVKLAVEIMDSQQWMENHELNLRDELFWFGKPWLLLRLIHFISFQNALEMATFLWSLWEIQEASCFMKNDSFIIVRLTFGIISQIWCSFITFPLYVIVAQMGSKFKMTVISETVRKSLQGWKSRVKGRRIDPNSASTSATPLLSNIVNIKDA